MAQSKAEWQREYDKRTGYAAQSKYNKEKVRRYVVNCITTTEQDLIDFMETKTNKAGYIKELIRKDMQNQK